MNTEKDKFWEGLPVTWEQKSFSIIHGRKKTFLTKQCCPSILRNYGQNTKTGLIDLSSCVHGNCTYHSMYPLLQFHCLAATSFLQKLVSSTAHMSSKQETLHYAAVSCDDSEKWGYSEATVQRLLDIHCKDGEQWNGFHAQRGQVPTAEDLKKFKGIIISGSPQSVHDNIDWILRLQEFIQSAAALPNDATRPKIIGVCFGHQLIAKALGGKVGVNPDKDFVLQTEEIKAVDNDSKLAKDLFSAGPLRIVECHGECVTELPEGAVTLGTSATCKHEVVQYSDNILGVQSHPEMLSEEAQRLVLPAISKRFKWSDDKIQDIKTSFKMDLKSDTMNKVMKSFLSE